MKKESLVILLLLIAFEGSAQLPNIRHNFSKMDSLESPLVDSFMRRYDFIIAYTEQGRLAGKNYKILAHANRFWSLWTYSDYTIYWTKENNNAEVMIDTNRTGQFLRIKKNIKASKIKKILSIFTANGFWNVNRDSLNQTRIIETYVDNGDTVIMKASITDNINYRFEILTSEDLRVIESYAPEYFLKLFPDMEDRRRFLMSRHSFITWWKHSSR